MGKVVSIIALIVYIMIIFTVLQEYENKRKAYLIGAAIFIASLALPAIVILWVPIRIAITVFACIIGGLFVIPYLIGFIVKLINKRIAEKIAEYVSFVGHSLIFLIPLVLGFIIIVPWIS